MEAILMEAILIEENNFTKYSCFDEVYKIVYIFIYNY